MIAWLVGIITLILLLFVIWRGCSKSFRERAELPKFKFLENLGIPSGKDNHALHTHDSQEEPDGKGKS